MKTLFQWLPRRTAPAVRLVLVLGLLLSGFGASAQLVRDRVYGTANGDEELGTMTPLPAGGYLMVGVRYRRTNVTINTPGSLYLLRLGANGDTLWTRKVFIPGGFVFYPQAATPDASGRVLVSGTSYTYSGTSRSDAFLAMLSPQGDTLWTKRVASFVNDYYYQPQLLPGGDFLVSGQLSNAPILQRLTPTGQVVWQQTLSYAPGNPGFVFQIVPVAGTVGEYWVPLISANQPNPQKFIRYNINGPTGFEVQAPLAGVVQFNIVPVGTGYILLNGTDVKGIDANFNILWTQTPRARGLLLTLQKIVPTNDGNFLVGGEVAANSGLGLVKISPNGTSLADTLFRSNSQVFMKGLAIDPASGDYVFAGYANVGPIGGADIFWTQWRRSLISSTRASQAPGLAWSAYPNPLADNNVTLQAEPPLRGTLRLRDALGRPLGTWPAAGQRTQTLPLPPSLPAGIYLLTLESPEAVPRTLRLVKP